MTHKGYVSSSRLTSAFAQVRPQGLLEVPWLEGVGSLTRLSAVGIKKDKYNPVCPIQHVCLSESRSYVTNRRKVYERIQFEWLAQLTTLLFGYLCGCNTTDVKMAPLDDSSTVRK